MQRVNRHPTIEQMLKVPFEHRAELFKNAVEAAAKKFMVELTCDYYHVAIKDKFDEHNEVYYHMLTQEE